MPGVFFSFKHLLLKYIHDTHIVCALVGLLMLLMNDIRCFECYIRMHSSADGHLRFSIFAYYKYYCSEDLYTGIVENTSIQLHLKRIVKT